MGLTGAPSHFQMIMNQICGPMTEHSPYTANMLDDIFVFSNTTATICTSTFQAETHGASDMPNCVSHRKRRLQLAYLRIDPTHRDAVRRNIMAAFHALTVASCEQYLAAAAAVAVGCTAAVTIVEYWTHRPVQIFTAYRAPRTTGMGSNIEGGVFGTHPKMASHLAHFKHSAGRSYLWAARVSTLLATGSCESAGFRANPCCPSHDSDGRPVCVVADFGLARPVAVQGSVNVDAADCFYQSLNGICVPSSPHETCRSFTSTPKSDVYSLALMSNEMTTLVTEGEVGTHAPWHDFLPQTKQLMAQAIKDGASPFVSWVMVGQVRELYEQMTARSPAGRPTMLSVEKSLIEIQANELGKIQSRIVDIEARGEAFKVVTHTFMNAVELHGAPAMTVLDAGTTVAVACTWVQHGAPFDKIARTIKVVFDLMDVPGGDCRGILAELLTSSGGKYRNVTMPAATMKELAQELAPQQVLAAGRTTTVSSTTVTTVTATSTTVFHKANVDCVEVQDECTAECESAANRNYQVLTDVGHHGRACRGPSDCQPGDGGCPTTSSMTVSTTTSVTTQTETSSTTTSATTATATTVATETESRSTRTVCRLSSK